MRYLFVVCVACALATAVAAAAATTATLAGVSVALPSSQRVDVTLHFSGRNTCAGLGLAIDGCADANAVAWTEQRDDDAAVAAGQWTCTAGIVPGALGVLCGADALAADAIGVSAAGKRGNGARRPLTTLRLVRDAADAGAIVGVVAMPRAPSAAKERAQWSSDRLRACVVRGNDDDAAEPSVLLGDDVSGRHVARQAGAEQPFVVARTTAWARVRPQTVVVSSALASACPARDARSGYPRDWWWSGDYLDDDSFDETTYWLYHDHGDGDGHYHGHSGGGGVAAVAFAVGMVVFFVCTAVAVYLCVRLSTLTNATTGGPAQQPATARVYQRDGVWYKY